LFGEDLALTRRAKLPSLRRRIGVVFQEFRLLNHLSVFDNVALPLRIAGQRSVEYAKDVEELLTWVGLGKRIHAKPPTLSGGEQQRVAIARAVVAKPDLLLADEPTGNVDPDIGRRLIRLFVELNRFGTTVIIATHDRRLVESTPARELRLVDGNLVQMPGRNLGANA
jgi:cell division transport system ATP-binding protein